MNILAKFTLILIGILGLIGFAIAVAMLFAFPVMWLWNGCVVGLIAGVSPITSFWQAFGLMVLCSLLFKSSSSSKS